MNQKLSNEKTKGDDIDILTDRLSYHIRAIGEGIGQVKAKPRKLVDSSDFDFKGSKLNEAMMESKVGGDEYLNLIADSVTNFKKVNGFSPSAIKMPMSMLLHVVGLLPSARQREFWDSETKRINGMLVGVTEDGTLLLR